MEDTYWKTLVVSNLDHSVSEELMCELFQQMGTVKECKIIRESENDPYAFIEYSNHGEAETALSMNKRLCLEKKMKVNWVTSTHHHVYVGNLSAQITTETLRSAFVRFGEISNIHISNDSKSNNGYAFVSFVVKADADEAIRDMNGQWLGSQSIQANLSERKNPPPREKNKGTEINQPTSSSIAMAVNTPVAQNWVKFSYIWTIDNCQTIIDNGEVLESSTFSAGANAKLEWRLRINPKGLDEGSKNYISVHIVFASSQQSEVRAKFKFCILNANEQKTYEMDSKRAYCFKPGQDWGFKKFILRDTIVDKNNSLINEDKLKIFCDVSVLVHDKKDKFGSKFNNREDSDVTLAVGNRVYPAHKIVLKASSSKFVNDLIDEVKAVRINDVDPNIFHELLLFMYTFKEPNPEKITNDLLKAADKFGVVDLKEMCEEALRGKTSVETPPDTSIDLTNINDGRIESTPPKVPWIQRKYCLMPAWGIGVVIVCIGSLDLAAVHSVTQCIEIIAEDDKYYRIMDFVKNT